VEWQFPRPAGVMQRFSYSLKAVGIGTLYLSLWGSVSRFTTYSFGVGICGAYGDRDPCTIALSLSRRGNCLATFPPDWGLFATRCCFHGAKPRVVPVRLLCLLILRFWRWPSSEPWRAVAVGKFCRDPHLILAGTAEYYSQGPAAVTVFLFAALFAALFAIVPLATRYDASTGSWTRVT